MGALTAITSTNEEKTFSYVLKMMNTLKHRGHEAYGIATKNLIEIHKTLSDFSSRKADTVIGYNFTKILSCDVPQPLSSDDVKLAFEGRIYSVRGDFNLFEILEKFRRKGLEGANFLLKNMNGAYSFVAIIQDLLVAGRDPIGLIPLYYGEKPGLCAVATEKKALWTIGINHVKSFPPGHIGFFQRGKCSFRPIKILTKPRKKLTFSMEETVDRLKALLFDAVASRTRNLKEAGLAFSGGLDSSIVALLLRECCVDVNLITVGSIRSKEIDFAANVAEELSLPIHIRRFKASEVEEILFKVIWLIEESSPLSVSIAIPFYWIAETAADLKLKVLFAGQGGDELFGGYKRYLDVFRSLGVNGVEEALFHDVKMSYRMNFERDEKVCAFHGIEMRLPFADWNLINYALRIPASHKISSPEDPLRKIVLRKVAKSFGLPASVYERKKKAVQYSAGVVKILKRIAKKKGKTISNFVEDYWKIIRKETH